MLVYPRLGVTCRANEKKILKYVYINTALHAI